MTEPFGRQPQPVVITVEGIDVIDVDYWVRILRQRAEFKGDITTTINRGTFKIYPRAVND